jgi:hypothetical protein
MVVLGNFLSEVHSRKKAMYVRKQVRVALGRSAAAPDDPDIRQLTDRLGVGTTARRPPP